MSQRSDAWIHFSWFGQANWSALQVTRWSKESHESWTIFDTNYISLHYHFDCEGCVTSRARAVSIENLVIWKGSSQLTFKDFFCFALYIYIYIYFFFLWLTLCSYISLEITFVNFLTSTEWRSVIFFLFTLLILLNCHQINFSLRYSFPWFSFFSLEGSNESLEWALPDICS